MTLEKKPLEEMSQGELMEELRKINKKSQFQPRKLKSDSEGALLLDLNNKDDVEWFRNDGDYDVNS
jgi:hypothetical protein